MNNYTTLIDKLVAVIKTADIANLGTKVFATDEIVFNAYPVCTISPLSFNSERITMTDTKVNTSVAIRIWGKIEQNKDDVERTIEDIGEAIQTLLIDKVTLENTLVSTEPLSGLVAYPERFGEALFMYEIKYTGSITERRI